MSPYSIPLCTILTKCPAPFSPTQSQQGSEPTFAQIAWNSYDKLQSRHWCSDGEKTSQKFHKIFQKITNHIEVLLVVLTWKIGLMWGQAALWPPGIREGPYLAPSSPPLTCIKKYKIYYISVLKRLQWKLQNLYQDNWYKQYISILLR